ncbi:MAG: aminopeptidase P family protein [Fimbriimonadaceae bacterium]|nr:aminopeptidase P family protein [Fimbriimonadaceae bacterium]
MLTQTRTDRLASALTAAKVDVALLNAPITMDYMTGFGEGAHERFLALAIHCSGSVALICPALSATQATRAGITDVRGWRDGEDPYTILTGLMKDWGAENGHIAVDDEYWAKHLLLMQRTLPHAKFETAGEYVSQLMRQKDAAEIDLLRKAASVVDEVWEEVRGWLAPGQTELQIEAHVRGLVSGKGAKPTFCSVGSGPAGAEPHHLNDERMLIPGDIVVIDFGCDWHGYQADITRVAAISHAEDDEKKVYQTVYAAHMAGVKAAKIGAIPAEVDTACRKVIEDAGYGEFFVHRTGHGIGRRVHEAPDIASYNTSPLQEGDCFSIEPGIYLPGRFGVRLENIVTAGSLSGVSLNTAIDAELPVV